MFIYGNDSVTQFPTGGDMITIFDASQLDSVPMYSPLYKGHFLPIFSKTTCKEFDGDCMMFA